MTRYKNTYRDELDDEIADTVIAEPEQEPEKVLDAEEETFKKRYGDLRRFAQTKEKEFTDKIKALEEEKAELTKKNVQFPKTDEEFNAWASKYPDVVANIRTMIMKHNQEVSADIDTKLLRVKELETKIARDEAAAQLHKAHDDFFSKIRLDPKFHEWVEEQPKWIKEALYENETDAHAAIRAIDLYKADMGISKQKEKPQVTQREIAETVTRTSSSGPAVETGQMKYSESQVDKMSAREFEKHEAAIMEAIRTNKFLYDVTGAAR